MSAHSRMQMQLDSARAFRPADHRAGTSMKLSSLRRNLLTKPIYRWARHVLPSLSDTEREAIEAGDTWWDADLFSGNPDWAKLLAFPPARLSAEEQAFLDGPVDELCRMLDDWQHQLGAARPAGRSLGLPQGAQVLRHDHSEELRRARLFRLRPFGGHPQALDALAVGRGHRDGAELARPGRAAAAVRHQGAAGLLAAAAGRGEGDSLLRAHQPGGRLRRRVDGRLRRGLPRHAGKAARCSASGSTGTSATSRSGRSRPCSGSPSSSTIPIICSAIARTSASRSRWCRPTCRASTIGRRHLPSLHAFQNGPNWGRDVFIPMDYVIGGVEQVGKGWKMLMSALAAGRGISLPSLSAAARAFAAHTTGAYARVREQFHVPIGRFEAIQERLGRIAATAYLLDAARRLTCAAIDHGEKPAVVSAIMKAHATERMRVCVNDAMDIHGGKAVQDGPLNYLGSLYRAVPIGITVEGANILTRSLIMFGQGAIRCHPYLLQGDAGARGADRARGLDAFDKRVLGPCRPQHRQRVPRLGAGLDRRHLCAGAGRRRSDRVSTSRSGASVGLRARRRHGAAHARRRAQAQGDDLGALRRHPVRALPALGGAQALGGRGPPGSRSAAGRMVHGDRLRHHRGALRRDLRQFPEPAGGVAAALPGAAARAAPARAVRSR